MKEVPHNDMNSKQQNGSDGEKFIEDAKKNSDKVYLTSKDISDIGDVTNKTNALQNSANSSTSNSNNNQIVEEATMQYNSNKESIDADNEDKQKKPEVQIANTKEEFDSQVKEEISKKVENNDQRVQTIHYHTNQMPYAMHSNNRPYYMNQSSPSSLSRYYRNNTHYNGMQTYEMNRKYKTRICSQFISKGQCSYGPYCIFAHGDIELRSYSIDDRYSARLMHENKLKAVNKFRTEICASFNKNGFCKFGNRCTFAHGIDELRMHQTRRKYKTKQCANEKTPSGCRFGNKCAFLHSDDNKDQIANFSAKGNSKKINNSKRKELSLNTKLSDRIAPNAYFEEDVTPKEIKQHREGVESQIIDNLLLDKTSI